MEERLKTVQNVHSIFMVRNVNMWWLSIYLLRLTEGVLLVVGGGRGEGRVRSGVVSPRKN